MTTCSSNRSVTEMRTMGKYILGLVLLIGGFGCSAGADGGTSGAPTRAVPSEYEACPAEFVACTEREGTELRCNDGRCGCSLTYKSHRGTIVTELIATCDN